MLNRHGNRTRSTIIIGKGLSRHANSEDVGLVDGSMGTVKEILFENQGPPALPAAVFIKFEKYNGPMFSASGTYMSHVDYYSAQELGFRYRKSADQQHQQY